MKKILAIVAVLAMVFALTVPALAAGGSVVADDLDIKFTSSSEKPSDAEIGSGNKLLGVWDAKVIHTKDGSDATAEETAQYLADHGNKIDFSSVVGSVSPVKVLHKVGGSWKSESYSGSVVTGLTSLSPFAFVVKADSQGGGGAPSGGRTSQQTGYNTALWTIATAAMVVCAGYCFVSARRKAAE